MGQISFNKQKPKYCNLRAIQSGGSQASEVPANGEVWLVDTSNSKSGDGVGYYDSYIVGDNSKTCAQLASTALLKIDEYQKPSSGIPKTDLASDVQTSLSKADSALQSHQDITGKADKATTLAGYGIINAYTKDEVDAALENTGSDINTVTITVDDNTGTPSGTATISGSTLALNFSNLKGVKGDTGATGAQGPQGERGPAGTNGVTTDATIAIVTDIDTAATYDSTKDVASAEAVQNILKKTEYEKTYSSSAFGTNGYYENYTGTANSNSGFKRTDLIPVKSGDIVEVYTGTASTTIDNMAVFDSERNWIFGLDTGGGALLKYTFKPMQDGYVVGQTTTSNASSSYVKVTTPVINVKELTQVVQSGSQITSSYTNNNIAKADLSGTASVSGFKSERYAVTAGSLIHIVGNITVGEGYAIAGFGISNSTSPVGIANYIYSTGELQAIDSYIYVPQSCQWLWLTQTSEMPLKVYAAETHNRLSDNWLLPDDIVNNLSSDSSTKVLSAAQGKVLNGKVDVLHNQYNTDGDNEVVDISEQFHFVPNSSILIALGAANGQEPGKLAYNSSVNTLANDNYVDISGYNEISITIYSNSSVGLCIYDENHDLLETVNDSGNQNTQSSVTIPILSTYKYIRTTISNTSTFSCTLTRSAFTGLQKINEDKFRYIDVTDDLLYGGKAVFDNVSFLPRISGSLGFRYNRIYFSSSTNTFILFKVSCGINNKMYVKASENGTTVFFFKDFVYKDNVHAVATCATGYESTNLILSESEEKTLYLPSDCCYVAFVYNTGRATTTDVYPQKVTFETTGAIKNLNNVSSTQRYYSSVETNILELLAHKNTTFYKNGAFYTLYMCDDTQGEEYVPTHTTIKVRLGIRSILDLENTISVDVFQAKAQYGDIVVSDYSPSNCGMAMTSDTNYLYMYANVRPFDTDLETAVMRKFNIANKMFDGGCTVLTLNGDPFTLSKVISCYNTDMGTSISTTQSGTTVWGMNLSSQICLASNGYYYWGIGASVSNFGGIIVKSTDLINWTYVTAYNLSGTTSTTVWEIALAETETGVLTVAERANMIYVGAYNFSNNTWVKNPTALANTLATRPFFFKYSNKTYMVCNINGASSYATRATIGIYEVTSAGEVSSVMTKQVVTGCHYAEVVEANSELYIFYSSDPKRIYSAQAASKIVCEKLILSE